jgi:hypothetical protein
VGLAHVRQGAKVLRPPIAPIKRNSCNNFFHFIEQIGAAISYEATNKAMGCAYSYALYRVSARNGSSSKYRIVASTSALQSANGTN